MTERCPHCHAEVPVTRWDKMMGFTTRCPNCTRWAGQHWSAKRLLITLIGGLVINGFIFFFVMRPLRALMLFITYVGIIAVAVSVDGKLHRDVWSTFSTFIFFPALYAAWYYVAHERELDGPPLLAVEPYTNAAERTEGIQVYQRLENLKVAARATYSLALLDAIQVMIDRRWIALILPLIAAGLAHAASKRAPFRHLSA